MTKKQVLLRIVLPLGILALLVGGAVAARQYMRPFHRTAEMTVCNLAGETKTVTVSVAFRRHILAPTKWIGSVTFDGVTYSDLATHRNKGSDPLHNLRLTFPSGGSFWKNVKGKWGEIKTAVVGDVSNIYPSTVPLFAEDPFEAESDIVASLDCCGFGIGDAFEIEFIMVRSNDYTVAHFFGPAETVEEAERIKREIFKIELPISYETAADE